MMIPQGPQNAKILILEDYPDPLALMRNSCMAGPSGDSLARMLHEAGLTFAECLVATLSSSIPPTIKGSEDLSSFICHTKSPKISSWTRLHNSWICAPLSQDVAKLAQLIDMVKPNLIVTLGSLALTALTGHTSVKKWRGSQLRNKLTQHNCTVIPIYHPRFINKDYSVRPITVHDLKRAKRTSVTPLELKPQYQFKVRPTFSEALGLLRELQTQLRAGPLRMSIDIETKAGHLECIGFATNKHAAFCIPLMCNERHTGYWSEVEETVLVGLMREIMEHPNAQCFGQNFIYDVQYIWRFWFCTPRVWYDTMTAQHCMFPGQPKGLDYLASMYCAYYLYWKDDGKISDPNIPEEQRWTYNCEDCVRTFEVMEEQFPQIAKLGLTSVWDFQQNTLAPLLLDAMKRGIRADVDNKALLSFELMGEITEREAWLKSVLGHDLNIKSPKQMQEFFYVDLGFPVIKNRKTHAPTVDDKALSSIARKEPLLQGIVNVIQELRSLGVFKSTFVDARLDSDKRLRSSYNITGTETFRLSSSENAFGSGLNFQNIPKGDDEKDDPKALRLPNIRKLFLPDPGYTIFDMDLKSADFYTVVWEADDDEFRQALDSGIDMHGLNAKNLFGLSCGVGEVKKLHNAKRQLAKIWCHATNYGAGARNMAIACGITIHEAEKLRARWFQMHPGIEAWHKRAEHELHVHRRVSNAFGYRMAFFGRTDAALPEALAWKPQSTTGCVINRAWANIARNIPEVQMLIQVHDSLVGQYPTHLHDTMPQRILDQALAVVVPYERPLVIPAGIATSNVSWGDCE
jgi:DNA polymerase I-like protein with 3'-5' exonuclease and polymerase domains/uracil-DNA glycosylase